jgi:hypothetical protein
MLDHLGNRMKFTDLFIRRPVLAVVVNLVILIAGFQAIKTLNFRQHAAQRECLDHRRHGLCRSEREPGARFHHHTIGARHRCRRRH